MIKIGTEVVCDPRLAISLPIINLPDGAKRIRIRQRSSPFVYFFIKTDDSLVRYLGTCVDDKSAIKLIRTSDGNYTRSLSAKK